MACDAITRMAQQGTGTCGDNHARAVQPRAYRRRPAPTRGLKAHVGRCSVLGGTLEHALELLLTSSFELLWCFECLQRPVGRRRTECEIWRD
jgi:hypothetical protein